MERVYVIYNEGKLRNIYRSRDDALYDLRSLEKKGYRNARVQEVDVQPVSRESEPLSIETIEALKQCVERS